MMTKEATAGYWVGNIAVDIHKLEEIKFWGKILVHVGRNKRQPIAIHWPPSASTYITVEGAML